MVEVKALSIHSKESEQAVIGAVLVDENCFEIVKDWIPEKEFFYSIKHQNIW